jgi:plasmid maintenance system killer protein
VEIYFRTRKLADECNNERTLIAKHGSANAKKIMLRLNELQSVSNFAQISTCPPARRHALSGNRQGQYALDLKHPFRLILVPANEPLPYKASGELDLERVTDNDY